MKRLKKKLRHSRFLRNLRKNRTMQFLVIASMLVLLLLVVLMVRADIHSRDKYDINTDNIRHNTYVIEYGGKEYRYNDSITCLLLIGIDSTGEMVVSSDYGDQPRADNIDLIVIDRYNETIKILPISRDTITEVTKFSAKGYDMGSVTTHLGFAYSFGNGGSASSLNVCDAVSELLYGVDVCKYITTNTDSLAFVNNLIGGVTVEVPNNDLIDIYPEMFKGAHVEITDDNVSDFLRYRDTDKSYSNEGRMERQEAYLQAYIDKLLTMDDDDYDDIWENISSYDDMIQTNLSKSLFLKICNSCLQYGYQYNPSTDNLKIEGTNKSEDGYDVFYPDEDALKQLVVENFFIEL